MFSTRHFGAFVLVIDRHGRETRGNFLFEGNFLFQTLEEVRMFVFHVTNL